MSLQHLVMIVLQRPRQLRLPAQDCLIVRERGVGESLPSLIKLLLLTS